MDMHTTACLIGNKHAISPSSVNFFIARLVRFKKLKSKQKLVILQIIGHLICISSEIFYLLWARRNQLKDLQKKVLVLLIRCFLCIFWLMNFSPYPWCKINWPLDLNMYYWFHWYIYVKCWVKIEMHNSPKEVIYTDQ